MHIQSESAGLSRILHKHDDYPAFHAGYFVLTFLIAALFNLGMFALLIVAHMMLDYVKYTELHQYDRRRALRAMISESAVDIVLLLVGLVFAVYLHHSAGLVAASGILRSGGVMLRGLGIMVPKLEVLHHSLNALMHPHEHMEHADKTVRDRWVRAVAVSTGIGFVSLTLLLIAPRILNLASSQIWNIVLQQMMPWNF